MLKRCSTRIILVATALSTAACTVEERIVMGYGAGGATLGALVGTVITEGSVGGAAVGASVGAAVGGMAGAVTGVASAKKNMPRVVVVQKLPQKVRMCVYHAGYGLVYQAPCPQQLPSCIYSGGRDKRVYQAPCPQPLRRLLSLQKSGLCVYSSGEGKLFQAPCQMGLRRRR